MGYELTQIYEEKVLIYTKVKVLIHFPPPHTFRTLNFAQAFIPF
jgi:hypothetical protein